MQFEFEEEQLSMQLGQQEPQQSQDKNKNGTKNINIDSLKFLRDKIESLTVFHQVEILRILQTNRITFSENKNGVFVNLTYVNPDVIDKINEYIIYVYKQESQLNEIEEQKIVLFRSVRFFSKKSFFIRTSLEVKRPKRVGPNNFFLENVKMIKISERYFLRKDENFALLLLQVYVSKVLACFNHFC